MHEQERKRIEAMSSPEQLERLRKQWAEEDARDEPIRAEIETADASMLFRAPCHHAHETLERLQLKLRIKCVLLRNGDASDIGNDKIQSSW